MAKKPLRNGGHIPNRPIIWAGWFQDLGQEGSYTCLAAPHRPARRPPPARKPVIWVPNEFYSGCLRVSLPWWRGWPALHQRDRLHHQRLSFVFCWVERRNMMIMSTSQIEKNTAWLLEQRYSSCSVFDSQIHLRYAFKLPGDDQSMERCTKPVRM